MVSLATPICLDSCSILASNCSSVTCPSLATRSSPIASHTSVRSVAISATLSLFRSVILLSNAASSVFIVFSNSPLVTSKSPDTFVTAAAIASSRVVPSTSIALTNSSANLRSTSIILSLVALISTAISSPSLPRAVASMACVTKLLSASTRLFIAPSIASIRVTLGSLSIIASI